MTKKVCDSKKGQVSGTALTARLLVDGCPIDQRVNTKTRNKHMFVPGCLNVTYKTPKAKVKVENYFVLLDDTDIRVSYKIFSYLPSMDVIAFAITSKSMFNMILMDKNILKEEFAQKLYLDRWFTILPRKIGLSLGEISFCLGEDVSHLTFNERCSTVFERGLLKKPEHDQHACRKSGIDGLNCKHLPPFFQQEFKCKLAYSHCDVCTEDYCDCGIAPWIFAERTELICDCTVCSGLSQKSEEISAFKKIKDQGCPYCEKPFTLGDVDESDYLDTTCEICHAYHQGGYRSNYRCMGDCLSDTDKWINYCEECWEITFDANIKDYNLELHQHDDNISITFNEPAKDIFVKESNLMNLFQKDRQFFALNNWFMFVNEIMNYLRSPSYGNLEDYANSTKEWAPLPYNHSEECLEEEECLEKVPKDILLYDLIKPYIENIGILSSHITQSEART